ncbi:phage Gp37/Gp68 family protein [Acinetobacter corruptisaponis]|uniref:Phage Gp37/Gp68 family protein n=1 Tax=Acinetobacter corruptisaponis TaxID=3045147 RepID=A0ABY8S3P5_9GAMM|nr:phage Gp37/Gp68 family protein [Acinetobacter sp. KCTC 92772]WHP06347.1 phage Gp37/Gp68 family protein [Acinetobacter sp. KCTC 92772]
MSSESKIEWTERTWNPVKGCTKISPGCKHCYAETMSVRLKAMGTPGYEDGFKLRTLAHRLGEPLKRKTPTVYFVNSMSDLFHENVPKDFIHQVFDTIEQASWHTFQILTKRADRMESFFIERKPPINVWLGVSVEDQEYGVPRIDNLRRIKDVTIRFLSVEPLLEDIGKVNLTDIDWVIVGGESGKKARPMKLEWVESIRQQCEREQVAFFFKQWGGWGVDGVKRAKKVNGRELHGRTWDEMPEIL